MILEAIREVKENMKKNLYEERRLVLTGAICVLFVATAFSSVGGQLSDIQKENMTGTIETNNLTPVMMADKDWNYWNNSPHMYAIPDGNVGIGTTNPVHNLSIESDGAFAELSLKSQNSWPLILSQKADSDFTITNGNQVRLTIDPGGNVGIDTWDPQETLDVHGSIRITGEDAVLHSMENDGRYHDLIGTYNSWNPDTVYIAGYNAINLPGERDTTSVSVGGNGSEIIWINLSSGNVGVGTTEPSERIEIVGNMLLNSMNPYILFQEDGNDAARIMHEGPFDVGFLHLQAYPWPFGENTGLVITSPYQYVGIGTTNPSQKLEVNGNALVSGNLLLNGALHMGDNVVLGDNWLSGDGDNEGVYVNDDGNVGIGTNDPDAQLDVAGNISISGFEVIDDTGKWVGDPTGLQGPQGEQGPQGPQGQQGPQGAQGPPGESEPKDAAEGAEGRWVIGMKIPDFPGEWDLLPWVEDGSKIIDLEWSIEQPYDQIYGTPSGPGQHNVLTIIKDIDKTSVELIECITEQNFITEMILWFFWEDDLQQKEPYYKIILNEVYVVDFGHRMIHRDDGDFAHLDEISFTYNHIEWQWLPEPNQHQDSWYWTP